VILQVEDSGPGIASADLPRIFDPFFTTKFTGRGLGLATVLGIVQGHGGALRVRSTRDAGTRFELAFPIGQAAAEASRHPPSTEEPWTGEGSALLIDDDDSVRAVVAQMLSGLGLRVTAVGSGEAGLAKFCAAEGRFDLVVLDWLMPGMSGEQVLAALRATDPMVPVILISGYSAENLTTPDAHLTCLQKPMTAAQLRQAVRTAMIGELPRAPSPRFSVAKRAP
jgi:CheY-like chemotaxis protein